MSIFTNFHKFCPKFSLNPPLNLISVLIVSNIINLDHFSFQKPKRNPFLRQSHSDIEKSLRVPQNSEKNVDGFKKNNTSVKMGKSKKQDIQKLPKHNRNTLYESVFS